MKNQQNNSDMEIKKYANMESEFMFKRLIITSLLCVSFGSHATIKVDTTADTSGTSACSLRDAVAMLNSATPTIPIGGCSNTDSAATAPSPVIVLTAGKTYNLNAELELKKSMSLQTSNTNDIEDKIGKDNPVIRAIGFHRILNIDAGAAATVPVITISGVDFQGCGGPAICETNGGVIFNKGNLRISTSLITNGFATLGGAIYNENTGTLSLTTVELKNNKANQGAAVYTIAASTQISQSLIRDNQATAISGFAFYTRDVDLTLVTLTAAGLTSSTIYNNNAKAMNIVPGIIVNSSTIVGNQGGLTLNASINSALSNSIIGNNNGNDCTFISGDATPINNSIYTNTCGSTVGLSTANRLLLSSETLIAPDISSDGSGICALPPAGGLLCPFRTYPKQFTGYLLPRLVPALGATLAGSPIINKGYNSGVGKACAVTDQRGKSRPYCHIGAIQLEIPSGGAQLNGADIFYGQIARIDLNPALGDGQLIPFALCPSLFPTTPVPSGGWSDGCIIYTIPPTKGRATFDATNSLLTYTPTANFHGFDQFTYKMTTTTSYFSEAVNNKTITVTTKVVNQPTSGISSKTVGAGGFGIFAILALAGFAMHRRLIGDQS
jgi:rhombotarget A family protien